VAGGGAAAAPAPAPTPARQAEPVNEGRGSADLDRLMVLSSLPGEGTEARLVSTLAHVSDADYNAWLERVSGTPSHVGPERWHALTDRAQCATLEDEIAKVRAVALKYPTPKDAEAAGYHRVTGYVPGIAGPTRPAGGGRSTLAPCRSTSTAARCATSASTSAGRWPRPMRRRTARPATTTPSGC
jgi:hypothetical protein